MSTFQADCLKDTLQVLCAYFTGHNKPADPKVTEKNNLNNRNNSKDIDSRGTMQFS